MIIPLNQPPFPSPPLQARWLGSVPYRRAYEIQRSLHGQRYGGAIPDQLLLLEHPTVITLPRRSQEKNLLVDKTFLARAQAEIAPTDRGGEVTLHNPGQLVGYLICKLEPGRRDLHSLLRWIEERLAALARGFGVDAQCRKGLTGLWVGERKLASIGIAVKRWTTLHGFAINANNDLSPFGWIHPCGLVGVEMTSLAKERGHAVLWPDLLEATRAAFGAEWAEESAFASSVYDGR